MPTVDVSSIGHPLKSSGTSCVPPPTGTCFEHFRAVPKSASEVLQTACGCDNTTHLWSSAWQWMMLVGLGNELNHK